MDLGLKDKIIVFIGVSKLSRILVETILCNLKEEKTISIILDTNEESFSKGRTLQLNEDRIMFYETDVSNSISIENTIKEVFKKYKRIDVIINIFDFNSRISLETPTEVFMNSLNIENERHSFIGSNAILNSLEESGGNILNIILSVSTTKNEKLFSYNSFSSLTSGLKKDRLGGSIRENDFLISKKSIKDRNGNKRNEKEKYEAIASMCLFLVSNRTFQTGKQVSYYQGGIHYDNLDYMC